MPSVNNIDFDIGVKDSSAINFEPNKYLDYNPTLIQTSEGHKYLIFRRDLIPPEPARGSIWICKLSASNAPISNPQQIIKYGEDPRAIIANDGTILIFYCTIEKSAEGRYIGSTMNLARFKLEKDLITPISNHVLKKNPIDVHSNKDRGATWEKNWIPFLDKDGSTLAIYSHQPWTIIKIKEPTSGESSALKIEETSSSEGLFWDFGHIRGSTPPIELDAARNITFFHSSTIVGSRKLYFAGACTFSSTYPYEPLEMTKTPIFSSTYGPGAERFGWPIAASVIFPGGIVDNDTTWTISSGVDDGQVLISEIEKTDVLSKLEKLEDVNQKCYVYTLDGTKVEKNFSFISELNYEPDWPLARLPIITTKAKAKVVIASAGRGEFEFLLRRHFSEVVTYNTASSISNSICLIANELVDLKANAYVIGPQLRVHRFEPFLMLFNEKDTESLLIYTLFNNDSNVIIEHNNSRLTVASLSPRNMNWHLIRRELVQQ